MELSSSMGFAKESPSEVSGHLKDSSIMRYQVSKGNSIFEWMRWNGAYLYAYGCSLAGIICAIISPLSDMYQGNNLFPYVSEVIRSGLPRTVFITGCSVGLIPTLWFATNYFITAHDYNQFQKGFAKKLFYEIMNFIMYACFIYSAFSVIGVSYCDMDSYPEWHTLWSFSWVIITNIMGILQYIVVSTNLYTGDRYDKKYMFSKLSYLVLSIIGMVNFAVLGSYVPCHSFHLTMETCLEEFSEDFCFQSQLTHPDLANQITYRYYGHCPILHYIRGVGEFIAVVSTMFYLTTMIYDVKYMRSILVDRADISTSVGIFEETNSSSFVCFLIFSSKNTGNHIVYIVSSFGGSCLLGTFILKHTLLKAGQVP